MRLPLLICVLICATFLAGCEASEQESTYRQYRAERTLAKVCRDGTKIWSWHSKYWVFDSRVYPDANVSVSLNDVCGA